MRRTITVISSAVVALAPLTFGVTAEGAKPLSSSIALTKSAAAPVDVDGNGIDAGDTIRYTFTLKNTGARSLSSVSVTDTLLGTISCTPTTLAAGASATCSPVTYTITQANVDAGSVGSTATAKGTPAIIGGTVTSTSSTSTPLAASPAITFAKTAGALTDTDSNGTDPGDTIRYTFTLANSGNVTLANVGVSDPAIGAVSCSPTTVAPGASTACAATTYAITQVDIDAGSFGSTATATGRTPAGSNVSATSATTTALTAQPAVSFALTAGPLTDVDGNGTDPGDTISYSFSLVNTGRLTLTSVGVTEPSLGTISCSPTTLAPGASTSCSAVTYAITQADINAGKADANATAVGTTSKGVTVSASSSTNTPLAAPTTSSVSVAVAAKPGIDVGADGLLDMGDAQPFEYVVTNTGTSTLTGVAVQSSLADAVTCPSGSLAPAATVTCTSSHTITLANVAGSTLSNNATASASGPNGSVTSPGASASVAFDRMNIALAKGLPNLVSYNELVTKARALKTSHAGLAQTLIPTTAMNWNPAGAWSKSVETYAMPFQQVLLRSNFNYKGGGSTVDLGLAGTAPGSTTRMAFMASDPFVNIAAGNPEPAMSDPGMNQFNVNLLKWLLSRSDLTSGSVKVALVNTYGSTTSRLEGATRTWLQANAPALVPQTTECALPATTCLTGADLVIFGGEGSDTNKPTIANQVKAAYDAGTPILVFNDWWSEDAPDAIMEKFGATITDNATYWDSNGLQGSTRDTQLPGGLDRFQQVVNPLVDTTFSSPLALSDYNACLGSGQVISCSSGTPAFKAYQSTLSTWDSWITAANNAGTSWFTQARNDDQDLMRALVMLADKLRTGATPSTQPGDSVPAVTYPVPTYTDSAALTRTLFVDSTTMTAWAGNQAAGDTGTIYCDRSHVLAHTCTAPSWPGFGAHDLTLKATQNDEWQATGLDAKPGVPMTVKLTSDPGVKVWVRTFFQRGGTTKSGQVDGSSRSHYDRPQWLATDWIPVTTAGTTLSSPYGGPLYIRIGGSTTTNGTAVPLSFSNVATHPTVLDMTSDAQVTAFMADINNGAYYADLAGNGFQAHLPIWALQYSLSNSGTGGRTWSYTNHGGLQQLLNDFRDNYVFNIYRLAGLQIGTKPLAETMEPDVLAACRNLGFPCENPALNQRTQIQHVNFDLHANCGNLCSGNPIDSDGGIYPSGWGLNHEVGHNLQRQQLNVMLPNTGTAGSNPAAVNQWTTYSNKSGETSNNIFPYHTWWDFYRNIHTGWGLNPEGGVDTGSLGGNASALDAFAIAQSIRLGQNSGGVLRAYDASCNTHNTTDTTSTPVNIAIANAIWNDLGGFAFYTQMPILMDGKTLADGTVLNNGFGIYTLLYQAARGWSDATSSSAKWTAAAQATYGMSDFAWNNDAVYGAGRSVGNMTGNDFMLIMLSKITGYDWRPYFQLHGVLYTALADQQVTDNSNAVGGYRSFNNVFPALGGQYPFADMSNIGTVDMTSPSGAWPGAYDSSITTKSKVGFTPSTCP